MVAPTFCFRFKPIRHLVEVIVDHPLRLRTIFGHPPVVLQDPPFEKWPKLVVWNVAFGQKRQPIEPTDEGSGFTSHSRRKMESVERI